MPVVQCTCLVPVMVCGLVLRICFECAAQWRSGLRANPWRGGLKANPWRGPSWLARYPQLHLYSHPWRGGNPGLRCGAVGVVVQSASWALRRPGRYRCAVRVVVITPSTSWSLRRRRRGCCAVRIVVAGRSASCRTATKT